MNVQKEWFANWFDSKYYPILYHHRDEQEAAQFVDNLMQHLHLEKNAVVADMACGEGRYAFQLSKYVAQVIGFDLSAARINKAIQDFASPKVHFFEHDMRAPMHVNYFDAIFNFFTSFGYFNTHRDHLNAAKSLANGLKKKGVLVIDYFNAHKVKAHLVANAHIVRDEVAFDIKRYVADGKIVKEIHVHDQQLNEQFHFEERVSDVCLADFVALFEKVGLSLEATYGDYQLQPFDAVNSDRLIMIFRK